MTAPNNTANASAGRGVKNGYLFSAPLGTPLPNKYDTVAADLDPAFENVGYLSEDGLTNGIETDSEDFKDMNGDAIDNSQSEYTETMVFTVVEQKKATLSMEYGEDNVTDENGQIEAHHRSDPKEHRSLVALLVLKNGRRQTTVVPDCQVTEVGEKKYAASELLGRELTAKCYPDENGDHVIDYIESTETLPPFSKSVKVTQPVMAEPYEGKALSDLVGEDYKIEYKDGIVKAAGSVYKVDGWSAYPKSEQDKYYPVFRLAVPSGTTVKTTTLSKKQRDIVMQGDDDIIVAMDSSEPKREFTLVDPSDLSRTATLSFDASGCSFTTKE